ncbi:MAG: signal recognition particle-docking protein FtsY [Pseudomonadota bacterium]
MEQVVIQVRERLAQAVVWMPWLGNEQGVLLALGLLGVVLAGAVGAVVALRRRRRGAPRSVTPAQAREALPTPPPAEPLESAPIPPRAVPVPSTAPSPEARPPLKEAPTAPPQPDLAPPLALPVEAAPPAPKPQLVEAPAPVPTLGWLGRIRAGLSKTRAGLAEGLGTLFLGGKRLDDTLLEELETSLLIADVGLDATRRILDGLTEKLGRKDLLTPEVVMNALAADMTALLAPCEQPLRIPGDGPKPFVILVVGINGAGKTTTIGKLAHHLKAEGRSVLLAAGDTFRAAAVEQLQTWGARNDVPVVAQHTGADSASVIFDAVAAGQARGMDVVIADTAGRLHTQSNLMQELAKIKRVLAKLDPAAPHEVLLVVDGGTGQNALNQAQQFHQAVGLTGVAITKLDGTAKGGMLFAIAQKLGVPIRFIGVGEAIEDLQPFVARDFVAALLGLDAADGRA